MRVSTGSTSGTVRSPAPTPKRCSHECATTLAMRPSPTSGKIVATEFVSTTGRGTIPTRAKAASMMRRFCMSGVSRQRSSEAASCHVTDRRAANGDSAEQSSR